MELSDSKTIKELIEPHAEELKQQREKVSGNRTARRASMNSKAMWSQRLRFRDAQSFGILYAELQPHKQRELLSYIIKSIKVLPTGKMALFGRANLNFT